MALEKQWNAYDEEAAPLSPDDTWLIGRAIDKGYRLKISYFDGTFAAKADRGQANGYASLDAAGKIPEGQLPALAITDTFVVASQAAMLAADAQVGDIAIREDLSRTFVLRAEPATTLANWSELLSPTGGVSSVNLSGGSTGLTVSGGPITGAGTLTLDGILSPEHGGTGLESLNDLPVSALTQTALNGKANNTVNFSVGTGLSGGGTLAENRSFALSAGTIASLGRADSAVQPGALGNSAAMNVGTGAGTVAAGNHGHADATTSAPGFMSIADKSKLNGIAAGATANQTDAAATAYVDAGLLGKEDKSAKDVANGYVGLGPDGKISASHLPAIAITDTFVVATQAAMLALTAQLGDIAVRTDLSQTFVLRAEPATNLANWTALLTPGGGVTSVDISGGTTGFGFVNGPITGAGTITLTIANSVTIRTQLGLAIGSDVQAYSLALDQWGAKARPAGAVVGTTDAQTLTEKTLAEPIINGFTEGVVTASGTAFSPDLSAGTSFFYTTTGNATVTMPAAVAGKSLIVTVQYGGAHNLAWAGAAIRWPGGAAPAATMVNGKRDSFPFFSADGVSWQPAGLNI